MKMSLLGVSTLQDKRGGLDNLDQVMASVCAEF